MLDEVKGRIIAVCIAAVVVAAGLIGLTKLPAETLASITWLKPETAPSPTDTGNGTQTGAGVVELSSVGTFSQNPDYPTGCESASLYILLKYYDADVTMAEIVDALPKGPEPYEQDGRYYGADPEKAFVGDPRSSSSFGVYNGPVAKTAQRFRAGAAAESGVSLDTLKKIVLGGDPVIAWTAISYDVTPEVTHTWTDLQTGRTIQWLSNEHTVVVYGYDADHIYISDPYDGTKKAVAEEAFDESYTRFGQRIVYYR